MRKQCKKLSNIEKVFRALFAHSAFYKIHISGAANRHAPVQYVKHVVFFFCFVFLFFLSNYHDTKPFTSFVSYMYWLTLTVNHQGSYFPVVFFCVCMYVFIQWVNYFCTPANFVTI